MLKKTYSPLALAFLLIACGDDDTAPSSGTSSSSGSSAGTLTGEATIASCPAQSSLIEGKDWISCVSGRSFTGTEPFTNKTCELKIDADGGFSYLQNGAVTLASPRASWGASARGTYQNDGTGARRIFLASIDPELPAVEGQPRITRFNVTISGIASQQDTIEVQYLDAALARQTYNCQITSP